MLRLLNEFAMAGLFVARIPFWRSRDLDGRHGVARFGLFESLIRLNVFLHNMKDLWTLSEECSDIRSRKALRACPLKGKWTSRATVQETFQPLRLVPGTAHVICVHSHGPSRAILVIDAPILLSHFWFSLSNCSPGFHSLRKNL